MASQLAHSSSSFNQLARSEPKVLLIGRNLFTDHHLLFRADKNIKNSARPRI